MKNSISSLEQTISQAIAQAASLDALEQVRIAHLSRSGTLAALMDQLKTLSTEEKREMGPLINSLKTTINALYEAKKIALEQAGRLAEQAKKRYFDVTIERHEQTRGSIHIFTQLVQDLENIFISMGFQIASGPEVETDYYNFHALNIPSDHPARELHDTFWLTTPNLLLRTHTSTVQIHAMEEQNIPLAVFVPGRVFRNEATDATHDFMFMQAEGLLVDKNISIANLLATLKTFLQEFFQNKNLKIRARPGYFPFVEPGLEIDASCPFCKKGCSICKHTTWIELLGAGLIHPNVLRCSGIDPEIYSGFAFGVGLERLAMIKYGIKDIRLFRSGTIDFLDQF